MALGKIFIYLFALAVIIYGAVQFGLLPGALEWLQSKLKPSTTTTTPPQA